MNRSLCCWLILATLATGRPGGGSRGDEPPSKPAAPDVVDRALTREIIGPRQTLVEAIRACDAALPAMPAVQTVAEWESAAARIRSDVLSQVVFRGPAAAWRTAAGKVEWLETLDGGPGYRIKKVRYEALPGFWIPALLYEPENLTGKVPVVLNVNGHDPVGKAADYKQIRCINLAKRGVLALNLEWFGMGQFRDGDNRHDLINHLDLCGAGGIATHYLAMSRGIDLLLSLEHADPERVAVTGLSGGGWQTIFISALDTRVTLCNPVAGYSSFKTRNEFFSDLGDSEQTPCDLATVADYDHLTALLAPRPALLTHNASDDCCFASGHALPPLLAAATPIYRLYGRESALRSHVNTDPGTHNYLRANREAFYRMVGDAFYPGDATYRRAEIPSDAEVRTADALQVALPAENQSLHRLALELSKTLPHRAEPPTERTAARAWRDEGRRTLRDVVRARRFDADARATGRERGRGRARDPEATAWRVQVGDWAVPVVELVQGEPSRTVILLADDGRRAAVDEARRWLAQHCRVLVVDPFYVGEARVAERPELFALELAAVGERPLGIQAGQVAAIARWAKQRRPAEPVTVAAVGPRTSVMILVAANLEEAAIDEVVLRRPLASLKELIETKREYRTAPELFCFGLLAELDVRQIAALVVPRRVTILEPSDRARTEFAGLSDWYAAWGSTWNPLRGSDSR